MPKPSWVSLLCEANTSGRSLGEIRNDIQVGIAKLTLPPGAGGPADIVVGNPNGTGFAVNLDVDHARIAWMDMDRTPASRDLRDRFVGSGRFLVVATPSNEDEVQSVMDRGVAQAVVRVLPGFARDHFLLG